MAVLVPLGYLRHVVPAPYLLRPSLFSALTSSARGYSTIRKHLDKLHGQNQQSRLWRRSTMSPHSFLLRSFAMLMRCHVILTNPAIRDPLMARARTPIRLYRLAVKRCHLAASGSALTLLTREQVPILAQLLPQHREEKTCLCFVNCLCSSSNLFLSTTNTSKPKEEETSRTRLLSTVPNSLCFRFLIRSLIGNHVDSCPTSFDARLQGLFAYPGRASSVSFALSKDYFSACRRILLLEFQHLPFPIM